MAHCSYCNTSILFGGVRHAEERYCNDRCRTMGALLAQSRQVPDNVVQQRVWAVHQGNCPNCRGRGPVDLHVSHWVWSAIVMTRWGSTPRMSCRACATKSQLGGAATSLLFGWWGFPWGLLLTPVQVTRNLAGIFRGPDAMKPSVQLERVVRLEIASQPGASGNSIRKVA